MEECFEKRNFTGARMKKGTRLGPKTDVCIIKLWWRKKFFFNSTKKCVEKSPRLKANLVNNLPLGEEERLGPRGRFGGGGGQGKYSAGSSALTAFFPTSSAKFVHIKIPDVVPKYEWQQKAGSKRGS